jgi:pimeloyl-ACP methyl ester carboxylesterase
MRSTSPAVATALALAAGLVAAVAPDSAHAAGPPGLVWAACPPPENPSIVRDPRQECATLRVPLSYRSPRGRAIEIHVSRIATAEPGLRRGILVLNAGGPGDVGLDYPSATIGRMPQELRDRYDIVGFDPRGDGYSAPVTCDIPTDVPADVADGFPDADGSIDRTVPFARDLARRCVENVGVALPYINTANTARDINAIRAALGERRISYLGYSYGTYLGAVYRTLFPHRVDRMVLDGAIDPSRYGHEQVRLTGLAVELRLPDFLGWAAERDDRYGLGATPAAVRGTFDTLVARFDADPLPLPDGSTITGNRIRALTFQLLYHDATMPTLAETWQQLLAASGAAHVARPLPAIPADNQTSLIFVIQCNDGAWPRDVATYQRHVDVDRLRYPTVAGVFANIWPCAFWPRRVEAPVRVTGGGPRNVLIVQNLRDTATPLAGAIGLRRVLGAGAVLLTVDQGGHTAYLSTASTCANDTATRYLVHGVLPAEPTRCPGQALPA